MTAALIAAGAILFLSLLFVLPRFLLNRAQDRLAREAIAREGASLKLLTRAELVLGRYRRLPGILALKEGSLEFSGLYGKSALLPTSRIQKVVTGKRLSNGRLLFRRQVLRLTRSNGEEIEFVLTAASAGAWRSHLGLWAMEERMAQMQADTVVPGRR